MSDYDDEEYDDFEENYFDINNDEDNEIMNDLDDEPFIQDEQEQEQESEVLYDEDDIEDEIFEINQNADSNFNKIKKTIPILTKYEKTFVIGFRTQQILNGSNILIDINTLKKKDPYYIAVEELRLRRIPFKIKRKLPDNTYEIWDITDFEII